MPCERCNPTDGPSAGHVAHRLNDEGLAVFELLRRGHHIKPQAHVVAFDLLQLDGRDLCGKPIEARKAERNDGDDRQEQ
jgi:hypothetical protein